MAKKRSFGSDDIDDDDALRVETPRRARWALWCVVGAWSLPLVAVVDAFLGIELGAVATWVQRIAGLGAIALALTAIGLALGALAEARRSPRIRRGPAIAALLLALLSSVVWMAELAFAFRVALVREVIAADQALEEAPATDVERTSDGE